MELRHIRSFLAVADAGHLTRAADELNLSQPALSQQVRQLEQELGTALFDRIGRGIRLTDAGEVFRVSARRILHEVTQAQTAIDELRALARGTLAVGVVQTVNAYLIPSVVSRFSTAHPGIAVRVDELAADDVEQRLLEGTLGVGLTFVPTRQAGLAVEPLFGEELVLITSDRRRFGKRRRVALRTLADEPLVLLSQKFCTRRVIDGAFAAAGIRPRIAVEMNSIEGILRTVRSTSGTTIAPELVTRISRNLGLHAVRLSDPTPRRTIGIATLAGASVSAAAQTFADMSRAVIRELRSESRLSAR
ncbi:MAG TPA: transcriptional regulator CynR [Thermoanaerobaculia bacterium]